MPSNDRIYKQGPLLAAALLCVAIFFAPKLGGQLFNISRPFSEDSSLLTLLWSGDLPILGLAILAMLALGAWLVAWASAPVARLPIKGFILTWAAALFWLGATSLFSSYFASGSLRFAVWVVATIALMTVTMISGRGRMAIMVALAIVGAGTYESLYVVSDQIVRKATGQPDWRSFGSFFNPDFLAGYLCMTIPLTAGLILHWSRKTIHLVALGGLSMALALQLASLLYTQSRLGLWIASLALLVLLAWSFKFLNRRAVLTFAFTVMLAVPIVLTSGQAVQRATGQTIAQESHSGAFRLSTWKGAIRMAQAAPLTGFGLASFEHVYPRYAETGFTKLAHNSYLDIATESGVPALALLLIAALVWLARVARSETSPTADNDLRPLRIAVFCAVLAAFMRNFIDSDIAAPANLITLAALLGLGLSIAVDGVVPVPAPLLPRIAAPTLLLLGSAVWLLQASYAERMTREAERWMRVDPYASVNALEGSFSAIESSPSSLLLYATALGAIGRYEDAERALKSAIQIEPSTKAWYRLGNLYERMGKPAEEAWKKALEYDPRNLPAMLKLAKSDPTYYRRIAEIENSPYAQILATPEIVETAYAFANLELAKADPDQAKARLEKALATFERYRTTTHPIRQVVPGNSPERDREILAAHIETLQRLATVEPERKDERLKRVLDLQNQAAD